MNVKKNYIIKFKEKVKQFI